jgi:hypothetical protein
MKIKLILSSLLILASTGCVTSTYSNTRDIVYRDGSYYSPADEEYGDYYYAPESDYSYYDDYYSDPYYGFSSSYYSSPWYSHYSSRCRFSYRYDRYCNTGWGRSYLQFGGLTIIFGGRDYYSYGSHHYRYPYYGHHYSYGYPYYSGGYPYHGWQPPRPRPNNEPIPMPKPSRPDNQTPDYSINPSPGMRVPGEPIRLSTKPRRIDINPVEPSGMAQPGSPIRMNTKPRRIDANPVEPVIEGNPYVRVREPRPETRPENDYAEQQARQRIRSFVREDTGEVLRTKPGRVIISDNNGEERAYRPVPRPVRQEREQQPYRERESAPAVINYTDAPVRQVREERQERPAPRIERIERVERAERIERIEQPAPEIRMQQEEK